MDSKNPYCIFNLARICIELGDIPNGIKYLEETFKIKDNMENAVAL